MKRALAWILSVLMVAALLTGCGNNGNQTSDPNNSPNEDPSTSDNGNSSSPSKTLSIALSENLVTLDPHHANNAPGYQPRNMCFDPLVESDHEGNYSPCLAESWDFSEDGTQITFHLRDGVK